MGPLDALPRGERMSLFDRDKSAERMPVSLITGFLGSGKTTLLNKLLRHPGMSDSAVIINEFGEVMPRSSAGIDTKSWLFRTNG